MDLNLLRAFVALYETGSFTSAAQRLRVPRSTVSRAIAALEDELGEQLVHRTTRKVAISPEGKELFDRIAPSLGELTRALADRPERVDEPAGLLRVTSTPDLGASVLAEAAARFIARYPKTRVELVLSFAVIDLVGDGVDLALRVVNRRLPDSTLVAQKVGGLVFQLFAAPSYLARRGVPRNVRELANHEWVGFKGAAPAPLARASARPRLPEGRVACDDMFVLREVLRHGAGIGPLPSFMADADLQSGALVPVLPHVVLTRAAVYLVQPARKHVASRVAAFRALVVELLRQRPLARE